MRSFIHVNARTVAEACGYLRQYKGRAVLHAGGTDLLATLKAENLSVYPEAVINIKTIPGLDSLEARGYGLTIGANAKLSQIINSPLVRDRYPLLAEAAQSVATPQIRNAATIGGNLCQDVRCWYYRYPRHIGGPVQCARKGSGSCLAVKGDNRYQAVMEARKCFAVGPSDMAVALAALDARLVISGPDGQRTVVMTDFYGSLSKRLEKDEIIYAIEVPGGSEGAAQRFLKFTLRKPIDFAIVSVAVVVTVEKGLCLDASIALGALAPGPVRARKAEEVLTGRPINEETAAEASDQALAGARPLSMNAYKIPIAKTLIKRAILG
ncbi:MAG: FAD binding domain-containing protein [Deltaproteobacteria bacterium]|nr:FAD binding domain-containing protein [Deltaproteobacteria bacterium]